MTDKSGAAFVGALFILAVLVIVLGTYVLPRLA